MQGAIKLKPNGLFFRKKHIRYRCEKIFLRICVKAVKTVDIACRSVYNSTVAFTFAKL